MKGRDRILTLMIDIFIESKGLSLLFRPQRDHQPQLKQFNNHMIPDSGQNTAFQGQGSQVKKQVSPVKELIIVEKNRILHSMRREGIINYSKSPKYDINSIYQQTLKRPNYKKNYPRITKKGVAIYTSPYLSKNNKIKNMKKISKPIRTYPIIKYK